jgi:hypothetical protein
MLRRSKPNVLLLGREVSWLDLKRAVPRNAIETELRKRGCLDRVKFIFCRDALVWFAVALEAVLEFAVAFGKLRQNFITAWRGITQPNGLAETDHPPDRKAMTGDPGLVKLAHDVGSNDLVPFFPRSSLAGAAADLVEEQGVEGATLTVQNAPIRMAAIMAHAQEKQNSSMFKVAAILDSSSAYPSTPATPDGILEPGQRIGSIFIQIANFLCSETRLIDLKIGAHQGGRWYFLDGEAKRLGSRVKPFVPEICLTGRRK